jgi:multidrug resistance protein, MATE family
MTHPEATASGCFRFRGQQQQQDSHMAEPLSHALPATGDAAPAVARPPLAELLYLAGPTVAQMASYTVMQFIDTWMLSHLGTAAPTAAGNAGLLGFAVISFGVGVLMLVNTLVSQNFGQRDYAACGRYLWQGIWFGLAFSLLVLPLLPLAPAAFRWMGHAPALARLEGQYLQITLAAAAIKLVATAVGQFLLAIDRPRLVLVSAATGVTANCLAAWAMIFGHLGLPAIGLAGAAWAQNVGVAVELLVLVTFAFRPPIRATFNTTAWRARADELRTLLRVGLPSGVQFVTDVLAWSMFSVVVMGAFGEAAMAANTFTFRYMTVSFMPAFGLSTAVTALVGRYIGMGRPDIAARRANLGFAVTVVYMLACGVGFFLGRHHLMGLFSEDPEVLAIGATLLVVAALFQLFDAMYILYNGALRGAGDTAVPATVTGVLCWGVVVFGGYGIARGYPQLGPLGPWAAALAYGAVLGMFMFTRFRRGGWRRIRLENDSITTPSAASNVEFASTTVTASQPSV